ncbi:hypothetical protein ES708_20034 [subsurface metagenome]
MQTRIVYELNTGHICYGYENTIKKLCNQIFVLNLLFNSEQKGFSIRIDMRYSGHDVSYPANMTVYLYPVRVFTCRVRTCPDRYISRKTGCNTTLRACNRKAYLGSLAELRLNSNELTGNIPGEMGNLNSLEYLDLSQNQLDGSIPVEICDLSNLMRLYLNENLLTGNIPQEIGELINLTYLYLGENQIIGSIPAEIGNLSNLTRLLLHENQLMGSIPVEIGNLCNLTRLILYDNQLNGPIPAEIGNLINMGMLRFRNNQLTGPIPSEIGNLSELFDLNFSSNQLNGPIPPEIGNLSNLQQLNLYENQLTGQIPPELAELSNLWSINLARNQLSGNFPVEIGNLSNLEYIRLHDNQLDGSIPVEIGNLSKLKYLELYENQFTGTIPTEIGNLSNLEQILLHDNQLTGSIPEEIGTLTNLIAIYIYRNHFSGPIPSGINSLTELISFRLYTNYFTFSDLEPIAGLTIDNFYYDPQFPIKTNISQINASTGDNQELDITDLTIPEITATNNQYQWWKDGVAITEYTDTANLIIDDLDDSNQGFYHCSMINSDFTYLTLFTDSVLLVIDGPVDITLTPDRIDENVASGTNVGILVADDPDQTGGHTFALAEGNGINDADNDLFFISSDNLIINTSPDYETKQEYNIFVRATDDDLKTLDKALMVTVDDLTEEDPSETNIHQIITKIWNIYPNPVSDNAFLEYSLANKEIISVHLYDMYGQLVQSFITKETRASGAHMELFQIDQAVPPGNYMLVISNSMGKQSIKISKQ